MVSSNCILGACYPGLVEVVVPSAPDPTEVPAAKFLAQGVLPIDAIVHDYLSVGWQDGRGLGSVMHN